MTSINVDLTKKMKIPILIFPYTNLTNSNANTTASIIGELSIGQLVIIRFIMVETYPLGSSHLGACVFFVGFFSRNLTML